jgi:hypothetical protein
MRLSTKLAAPLMALALVAGACGGDEDVAENPKASLEAALDNLADYDGVTMTLSVAAGADDLVAASEGDLTEEDAQKIIDSSLTISAKEGETPEDSQFEMVANVAGNESAFEMKVLGTTLYARADVQGLVEEFGGNTSDLEAARQQFGSQPGFEFVGPALDGEWVSVSGFDQAIEQFTGQSVTQTPSAEDQEMIRQFAETLKQNVGAEAGDREGPGGHVIATLPLRSTYEEFSELAGRLGGLPPGAGLPPASEVPDKNVTVDVWIEDEQITQVELDFVTLAREFEEGSGIPEGVDRLALRLGIEEFTDDVQAPEESAEINLQQLMQTFLGGMGATATPPGGGTDGEVPAGLCEELEKQLEGQPQEVKDQIVAQFGADCPDLGK